MDDTHNFSPASIFDPKLWDDSEEFTARMKYEGRTFPLGDEQSTRRKLLVFLIGGPVLALLIAGLVSLPL